MHFLKAFVVGASALVGFAAAQNSNLAFTSTPSSVTAGQGVTITYTAPNINDPVTITLRKGDPANLSTIGVLTSSATGGSYIWIPSDSYASGSDYALQITQGTSINYSGLFSLSGGSSSAIAAASTTSAASMASQSSQISAYISSQASSIQSVISAYNSSLVMLTASNTASNTSSVATSTTFVGTGYGTGMPMVRNTTMSSATLSAATTTTILAGVGGNMTSSAMSSGTSASSGSSASAGSSATSGSAAGSTSRAAASSTRTSATAPAPASSGGAATVSHPIALLVGAGAAFFYLQ